MLEKARDRKVQVIGRVVDMASKRRPCQVAAGGWFVEWRLALFHSLSSSEVDVDVWWAKRCRSRIGSLSLGYPLAAAGRFSWSFLEVGVYRPSSWLLGQMMVLTGKVHGDIKRLSQALLFGHSAAAQTRIGPDTFRKASALGGRIGQQRQQKSPCSDKKKRR